MDDQRPFAHVLVGVDADGSASDALVRGAALAEQAGAELALVHAVEIPAPLWPGIDQQQLASMHAPALAAARKAAVETLTPVLRSTGRDDRLDDILSVFPGYAAKVILQAVDDRRADVIVLGQHAKQSVFDFGSTARAVLSATNVPVWIQNGPSGPVKRILVPIDFSEHSAEALDQAHRLARHFQASIRVMHCYSPPRFAHAGIADAIPGPTYVIDRESNAAKKELERWMDEFEWGSVAASLVFTEGDPAARILEQAEGDDLIVMGTHGRSGLSRFLVGSVAHVVIKRSKVPVLAIPSPHRTWLLDVREPASKQDPAATPPTTVY